MFYLKLAETEQQVIDHFNDLKIGGVGLATQTDEVIYHHKDWSLEYLTFTALQNTTFTFSTNALQYSLDNGQTWNTLAAGTASPTVTAGNKIMWKQTGLTPTSSDGMGTFSATGNFEASGNVMSLYYGDNFVGQTDLTGKDYAFNSLFSGNTNVVNAKDLILPATTLATGCYKGMFKGCTSLTTTPELPAETLAESCYRGMFQSCTSLITVPSDLLPATTLASSCYQGMFQSCTSLTTVPSLPAETLAESCYRGMFQSCTSLITVPSDLLPATTLAGNCYRLMFQSCTSLITVPSLPAETLTESCYYLMFEGCTSLTTVPSDLLPATTLAQSCYQQMFQDTSLTAAPQLPVTTLTDSCYNSMFNRCTSLTTAPELPATTLADNCYRAMFQGCTNLNYIKCLATDISASNCLYYWVNDVASSGTFIKDSTMTSWPTGTSGIPSGWTVQDA